MLSPPTPAPPFVSTDMLQVYDAIYAAAGAPITGFALDTTLKDVLAELYRDLYNSAGTEPYLSQIAQTLAYIETHTNYQLYVSSAAALSSNSQIFSNSTMALLQADIQTFLATKDRTWHLINSTIVVTGTAPALLYEAILFFGVE